MIQGARCFINDGQESRMMMMAEPPEQPDPGGRALLCLGRRDTSRLLEAYVRRSLSLNDGSPPRRPKASKWTAVAKRLRPGTVRSSSDGSAHLWRRRLGGAGRVPSPAEAPPTGRPPKPSLAGGSLRRNDRKEKGSSTLKGFLDLFSRKAREPRSERTGACGAPDSPARSVSPTFHFQGGVEQHSQRGPTSSGKRCSVLTLSHHSPESAQTQRAPSFRILPGTEQAEVVSVEPTSAYYENVSQELERIVKEVKDSPSEEVQPCFAGARKRARTGAAEALSSDEETIEKIISLLKQQGDDFNVRIKESAGASSFFQSLSYGAFRQLADRYVEEEVPSELPADTAAPELVKFAFTLDFTAKVAGLSNQAVSRIMGFGNQYLQDRFTQMIKAQVPVSRDEAVQSFMDPD
ncbi:uncharacterized protein LOC135234966 isoform X2 [Anguilla rostrata]|uniref:uncharacterized protein LOC135234966 isoform X2 n=1 Tax=Anguilla rostrata TaxID=7938 RepID=UPI0030D38D66